jgi:hypothetical protein
MHNTREEVRGEEVRGGEMRKGIQRGCYDSDLFTHYQECIHSANSVEKRVLNGSKWNKQG